MIVLILLFLISGFGFWIIGQTLISRLGCLNFNLEYFTILMCRLLVVLSGLLDKFFDFLLNLNNSGSRRLNQWPRNVLLSGLLILLCEFGVQNFCLYFHSYLTKFSYFLTFGGWAELHIFFSLLINFTFYRNQKA